MGKYSIENYEKYKMIKCRPAEDRTPVPEAGYSYFTTVEIRQEERPVLTGKTLLRLHVSANGKRAETEAAVRRLASRYYTDPAVVGVTVAVDGPGRERMWETAAEAFAPKRFIVPVTDGEMLDYALKHGFFGGLFAEVLGDPLNICEAFAKHHAQRLFERYPVFVRFADPETADGRYALQWHASAVEGVQELAGARIALRRLNYPKALTSGGFAPMQFWWTNRGPAPFYDRTEVKIRLLQGGKPVAVILPGDKPDMIPIGDRVFNRVILMPALPEGQYRLQFGLFRENGSPIRLANTNPSGEGYYDGDVLNIDHIPRPELEHIWETYRPDGYYPLEDPAQPGE